MMERPAAEILALDLLAYLVSNSSALENFLALTGSTFEDLRTRAGDAELLAAIVDFVLSEENLCAGYLQTKKLDAKILHAARRALPGAA
jgi:uncharacterized protein DUF3572